MKIYIVLTLSVLLLRCGNSSDKAGHIDFSFVKKMKEFKLSKIAKYNYRNIFSKKDFTITRLSYNRVQVLHRYPRLMHVDLAGIIYIKTYTPNVNGDNEFITHIKVFKDGRIVQNHTLGKDFFYFLVTQDGLYLLFGINSVRIYDPKKRVFLNKLNFHDMAGNVPYIGISGYRSLFFRVGESSVSLIDVTKKNPVFSYRYGFDSSGAQITRQEKELLKTVHPKMEKEMFRYDLPVFSPVVTLLAKVKMVVGTFSPFLIGIDGAGNKYYAFGDIGKILGRFVLEPILHNKKNHNNDIVINTTSGEFYKKFFRRPYEKMNYEMYFSRSFYISPNGVLYILSVNKGIVSLDKYVPDFLLKEKGNINDCI